MTNFAGSASDVSTLAHELGHAFNNRMLHHKPIMMTETPMPLAETASTFNETLLISQLLKTATPEEELTLLDSCLTEQTQTMVDIYSRFLFEQKVVAAQEGGALELPCVDNLLLDLPGERVAEDAVLRLHEGEVGPQGEIGAHVCKELEASAAALSAFASTAARASESTSAENV